jgi:hypothetical protein
MTAENARTMSAVADRAVRFLLDAPNAKHCLPSRFVTQTSVDTSSDAQALHDQSTPRFKAL